MRTTPSRTPKWNGKGCSPQTTSARRWTRPAAGSTACTPSTLLKGEPSYKNVICLGLILDERGRKMSKRVGNVVEPLPLLDEHGADALRWYLFTASQPGEARRFSSRLVNQTLRQVLLTLWNIYSFFTGYAAIDKFDPIAETRRLEAGERAGPLGAVGAERAGGRS